MKRMNKASLILKSIIKRVILTKMLTANLILLSLNNMIIIYKSNLFRMIFLKIILKLLMALNNSKNFKINSCCKKTRIAWNHLKIIWEELIQTQIFKIINKTIIKDIYNRLSNQKLENNFRKKQFSQIS